MFFHVLELLVLGDQLKLTLNIIIIQVTSGIDKAPVKRRRIVRRKSENTLLSEKERLQKMERELRLKLEKMKKLSEAKQLVREKVGRKQNLNTEQMKPKNVAGRSKELSKKAPSNSTNDLSTMEDQISCIATSTITNVDLMDVGRTVSKTVDADEQDHSNLTKPFDSESQGDLRFVLDNRVEGRLKNLFQDQKKVAQIVEKQASFVFCLIFSFLKPFPYSLVSLAKLLLLLPFQSGHFPPPRFLNPDFSTTPPLIPITSAIRHLNLRL